MFETTNQATYLCQYSVGYILVGSLTKLALDQRINVHVKYHLNRLATLATSFQSQAQIQTFLRYESDLWMAKKEVYSMGDLQDPKMEVRYYHISGHILWGYSLT